jgi:hypothetical protein
MFSYPAGHLQMRTAKTRRNSTQPGQRALIGMRIVVAQDRRFELMHQLLFGPDHSREIRDNQVATIDDQK